MEEMDILFGAVQAEKRQADIEKEEQAFDQDYAPTTPEVDSVRSDFGDKKA